MRKKIYLKYLSNNSEIKFKQLLSRLLEKCVIILEMDWNCGWCRLCDCRLLLDTETHSRVSLQAPFYLLEHKLCGNLTNFSRKIAKNMFAYNYWYIRTLVVRLKCVWTFHVPAECENGLFAAVCCFSGIYGGKKEKATNDFHRLSPCVGMRRLERPTPTSRT